MPEPTPPAAGKPSWILDERGLQCMMHRRLEGTHSPDLAIRTIAGTHTYDVALVSKDWPSKLWRARKNVVLAFVPGTKAFDRPASIALESRKQGAIRLLGLPIDFIGEFGKSSAFSINAEDAYSATYNLPAAAAVAEQFARCEAKKLIGWGADPAGLAPGSIRPAPIGDSDDWLQSTDLKGKRTSDNIDALARLRLSPAGQVTSCEILSATGYTDLGKVLCPALEKRARYTPARDKNGSAVASVAMYQVQWVVRIEAISF